MYSVRHIAGESEAHDTERERERVGETDTDDVYSDVNS